MYGIPIKYLAMAGGALALILMLTLHARADNKRQELLIVLQLDLRQSEQNFDKCAEVNAANVAKMEEQQASIENFAAEKQAALEGAEIVAAELARASVIHERETTLLRDKIRVALQADACANQRIPDDDVLRLLNAAIRTASAG